MLLKLMHFSFNTIDLEKDMKFFSNEGYCTRETYKNVTNPTVKTSWMSNFSQLHDLCIMERENAVDVELVSQNSVSWIQSFICDVINRDCSSKNNVEIVVRANYLSSSLKFWKNLGFKFDSSNGGGYFSQILPGPRVCINISHQPDFVPLRLLDAPGFYSMAFLSSNAVSENKKLKAMDMKVTEISLLKLGEKQIRFFFVLGTQGELIEIYDVKSESRDDEGNY